MRVRDEAKIEQMELTGMISRDKFVRSENLNAVVLCQ